MSNCKPLKSPISPNEKFTKATDDNELADESTYRSLIGSLLFLAKQTQPDILFGVNVLSRFMAKPIKPHMNAVQRILRYLRGLSNLKIAYCKQNNPILLEESDADRSGNQNDRKSNTGFYFKYGQHSGAILWQVRKQQPVALSNCQAEYQGLAAAAREEVPLRQLLADLHYPQNHICVLGEDNQSAIKLSTHPVFHKRSKHIDVKQRFLRDAVQVIEIKIRYVPTQKMAGDIFTKRLCELKFKEHRENIMGRLHPNF